jgi:hypothetical protein
MMNLQFFFPFWKGRISELRRKKESRNPKLKKYAAQVLNPRFVRPLDFSFSPENKGVLFLSIF